MVWAGVMVMMFTLTFNNIVTSALLVEEVTDKQQYYRYIMTVSFIGGGSSH